MGRELLRNQWTEIGRKTNEKRIESFRKAHQHCVAFSPPWIVGIFYGIFAVVLAASWKMHSGGGPSGFWAIEFGVLGSIILGGVFYGKYHLFGSSGIVAPFEGNEILAKTSRSRLARLFYPAVGDQREISNDERALRRRDYSHYIAFRYLGSLTTLAFLLEYCNSNSLHEDLVPLGLSTQSVHLIVYLLLQIGWVFSMTLPQAILIWTEPDMEEIV